MAADPLTAEIETSTSLVVLSPHLDDAVLSCGALLTHAHERAPVTVATFFTRSCPPPHTLSARRYLRLTGASDAEQLYASRRAEDRAVLGEMGLTWRHFPLPDGLFRHKPGQRPGEDIWSRWLPERAHIYPTYRLHLSSGRISRHDSGTLQNIVDVIRALVSSRPGLLLLAPLAIGGHVDHVLVRTAAELSGQPVVYYSDFPYNQHETVDPAFTRRNALVQAEWAHGIAGKTALIRGYRSQSDSLFPGGRIPLVPEVYLLPDKSRTGLAAPAGGPS